MNDLERRISELPLPKPSKELDDRVQQLLDNSNRNSVARQDASDGITTSSIWNFKMPYRSAVVLTTVTLLMVMATWPRGSSQALAFGDVVESAKHIRTVQYVFKRVYFTELPGGGIPVQSLEDGEYHFETDMREVAEQQARSLEEQIPRAVTNTERQELNLRIDLLRNHTQPEQPQLEHAVRVRAAIGGLERREPIFPPSSVSISNAQTGKNVAFDNVRRKMIVIRHELQDAAHAPPVPIDHIKTDVITQLVSIPETDIERLRDKMLNGRLVSGFRQLREMNGGTVQRDFWVDPTSRLPVRIEKRFFEKGSSTPSIYGVYSDFVYDEPLDNSLFSTELPPGYEVDQAKVTFHSEMNDDGDEQ